MNTLFGTFTLGNGQILEGVTLLETEEIIIITDQESHFQVELDGYPTVLIPKANLLYLIIEVAEEA